ncbi:hypothetical protein ACROYT_G038483 [Oculina patagonica]
MPRCGPRCEKVVYFGDQAFESNVIKEKGGNDVTNLLFRQPLKEGSLFEHNLVRICYSPSSCRNLRAFSVIRGKSSIIRVLLGTDCEYCSEY